MHYLIYKITNKINNKIYIGKHITKNINDNYMGSGKLLRYAFNKYGIENFSKEILFECNSLEELNEKEKEIVNQKFVERDDTYNLKVGGDGGWDFCNDPSNGYTSEIRSRNAKESNKRPEVKSKQLSSLKKYYDNLDSEILLDRTRRGQETRNRRIAAGEIHCHQSFLGKHHSEETKQKMRDTFALNKSNVGSKNSNYGKHWWKDPNDRTKYKSFSDDEEIPEGWVRGKWQNYSEEGLVAVKETNLKRRGKYIWIYNPILDIQKLVSSDESLPEGWILGRQPNSDSCREKLKQYHQQQFDERKDKKYEELKPLFDEYMLNGFKSVKEKFDYKYSIVNLIGHFNKYIPEYKNNKKFPKNKTKLSKNIV